MRVCVVCWPAASCSSLSHTFITDFLCVPSLLLPLSDTSSICVCVCVILWCRWPTCNLSDTRLLTFAPLYSPSLASCPLLSSSSVFLCLSPLHLSCLDCAGGLQRVFIFLLLINTLLCAFLQHCWFVDPKVLSAWLTEANNILLIIRNCLFTRVTHHNQIYFLQGLNWLQLIVLLCSRRVMKSELKARWEDQQRVVPALCSAVNIFRCYWCRPADIQTKTSACSSLCVQHCSRSKCNMLDADVDNFNSSEEMKLRVFLSVKQFWL